MHINPNIESSYRENNIGKTIYDIVTEYKPKTVVEFGCLYGYSTTSIGLALRDNKYGKLYCYDLFDEYKYKHSTIEITKRNVESYFAAERVEYVQMDFYEWLKNPTQFDILHLDISNTGDVILDAYNALKDQIENGSIIIFEGGSEERDQIEWMQKYGARPINSVKEIVGYEVLNPAFPSISIIKRKNEDDSIS